MAEAGAHLWIAQADSDWWASRAIFDPAEHRSFPQAISKYQQTVEKSIKAIAAALRDRLIVSITIGYKHDVVEIASALRRWAGAGSRSDIQHHIKRFLNPHILSEIKAIDALAPRRPSPGALHARNTEYPFELISGSWTAPVSIGVFTQQDVTRFRALAERIYTNSKEIVSALRR